MAVAGRGSVVDMDDEADAEPHSRDEEVGDAGRFGPRPLLVDCGNDDRETEFLVERIRGIVASGMMGLGGIGIFVPINSMVRSTLKRLGEHDISATA
jgi:hypothetical protein